MGGEQRPGANLRMDSLHHRPRQRQAVVGGRAPPDLVQHQQAALGGGIQNHRRFGHLHHEGGPSPRQVVRRPDAREHPVRDRQQGAGRGHIRSSLSQDGDQRGLPQIRRLAPHVRPGDHGDELGCAVQKQIVGNEARGVPLGQLLDHRVASGRDAHFAQRRKARTRVAILRRNLRQRGGDVQFRNGRRRLANASGMAGRMDPQRAENLPLQRQDFILGVQHLALEFLQLRRGEALRPHQGLLALIIGRRQPQV